MDPIAIHPLASDRLPILADVVGRAFSDDPMILWPLSEANEDRREQLVRFFSAIYDGWFDRGSFWEAGDGLGFANWFPPGGATGVFETSEDIQATLDAITDDGGTRYEMLWAAIDERVPDDVWFLDMVAVDPDHQGRGIGSALIRFGLERAVPDGADAFLETAISDNVSYYERFGFRVVEDCEPIPGGPHLWFMQTGS